MSQGQIDDQDSIVLCGRGTTITSIHTHTENLHKPAHHMHCQQHYIQYMYYLTDKYEPACFVCNKKLDEYTFYTFSQNKEDYRRDIYYITCSHRCPGIITDNLNHHMLDKCVECKTDYIYMRYDNRICPDCLHNKTIISCYKKIINAHPVLLHELPHELIYNVVQYYAYLNDY